MGAPHLEKIVQLWSEKLRLAQTDKADKFGNLADECWRFFTGPHDFIYDRSDLKYKYSQVFIKSAGQAPMFRMTCNKAAELVQLFLPVLYHRNPIRTIEPRSVRFDDDLLQWLMMSGLLPPVMPGMPMPGMGPAPEKKLIAALLSWVLNYTPGELDLRGESRIALTEALIKGRGLVWTERFEAAGRYTVGSFFDSVDNMQQDPDAQTVRHAKWVARRRLQPKWQVAKKFGIPEWKIQASMMSFLARSEEMGNPSRGWDQKTSNTNDLVEYWEIYSRMGVGGRLMGADEDLRRISETFPENCYLAISPSIPFPLNLPDDLNQAPDIGEEVNYRLQWPIAFHADATHPWPFAELDFHEVPNSAWPASHLSFALGEQLFLDWAYTFLANKVRHSSRGIWLVAKKISKEMRKAIESGLDNEMVEVASDMAKQQLDDFVKYFGEPHMNDDILKVIDAAERAFEKRTGLSELMYGLTEFQMRSASEARVKEGQMNVRPDDMAQQVENWMTLVGRKEAIASSLLLTGNDVAPIFCENRAQQMLSPMGMPMAPMMGGMGGMMGMPSPTPIADLWDQFVANRSVDEVVSEFAYTIEAGSGRKPNREREIANVDEGGQLMLPLLQGVYERTGNALPVNAFIKRWARSRDFNADEFLLPDMQQMMLMQQQQMMAPQQQPYGLVG